MIPTPIRVAFGIDAVLVALHVANAIPILFEHPTRILDLGLETNLPTWWASAQLWTAALLIGTSAVRQKHPAGVWMAAGLLALLSIDETAQLHERLAALTTDEAMPITGVWPLVLAPLLVAGGAMIAIITRS